MYCKPLYALSALASPTAYKNYDEASILRYLRLFVSVTTEYGDPLPEHDRSTELMYTNERVRLQHQAISNVKLLVESIKEAAIALLDTGSLELGRHHVRLVPTRN